MSTGGSRTGGGVGCGTVLSLLQLVHDFRRALSISRCNALHDVGWMLWVARGLFYASPLVAGRIRRVQLEYPRAQLEYPRAQLEYPEYPSSALGVP
jgi:hypothetical protein